MMNLLKYPMALIWAMIYQLPQKTIFSLSNVLHLGIILLSVYLMLNPHFTLGWVGKIKAIPNTHLVLVEIQQPFANKQLAIMDELEIEADELDQPWFFGYSQPLLIANTPLHLIEEHTTQSQVPFISEMEKKQLYGLIQASSPKIYLIAGGLVILFGMLLLQSTSALLFAGLNFVASWHLLFLGAFLNWWTLDDWLIYPISFIVAVAAAAIAMRCTTGLTAFIFKRLSAITILILASTFIFQQYEIDWLLGLLFASGLSLMMPQLAYILLGSALMSYGGGFSLMQAYLCFGVTSIMTVWLVSHAKDKSH